MTEGHLESRTKIGIDSVARWVINEAFENSLDLSEFDYYAAQNLADTLVDINSSKDAICCVVKVYPEIVNDYLRLFGKEVKVRAKAFNRANEQDLDEKIKFSGLLGRYMREIKNASKGATQ